jgi:hypothetical protein
MFNILIHKGNTIKPILRFHFIPVKMSIIKKTNNNNKC